jgi:hypothetical protein
VAIVAIIAILILLYFVFLRGDGGPIDADIDINVPGLEQPVPSPAPPADPAPESAPPPASGE